MAVSSLELRPRGAIALLDAALRLVSRNTGVWALTLPAGALVTAALLHLADAVSRGRGLALPVLWLTLAWLFRGLSQGATCHYVQELLVGTREPGMWASLRAALARAPSLVSTVGYLFVFNGLSILFSMGLSVFFLSSHVVGYAVTMQGKGSVLNLYQTCSRTLGPARNAASGVRLMLLVQVLAFFNLHLGANFACFLGRKLLGIDLTYAERFASIDNPTWLLFLAAVTFSLFEPIKAATATLLLIDGRVRQEGLDLLASVQQLPTRNTAKVNVRGAALVLLCALLTSAPAVHAAERSTSSSELAERLSGLAELCDRSPTQAREWTRTAESLSASERLKFQRLLRRVETEAYGDEECETAMATLEQGVALAEQTATEERAQQDARAAAARAKSILERPEFAVTPPVQEEDGKERELAPPDKSLWSRFLEWLDELLKKWFKREQSAPPPRDVSAVTGAQVADVLAVVLIASVVGVLAWLLIRTLKAKQEQEVAQLEVSTLGASALSDDPASALSRPPEGWAHAADELAARGEYREAVRCLYLALLSRLHREGAITYDVTLSNWDYLRHFKGRRDWLPPFRELTRRFDFAWYGNLPVGQEGYRDFRLLTEPLLVAQATPEAAGA
jgi:hypothetical protein